MTTVDKVCAVGATLGEGPVWIGDRLWFVDILEHRVHCYRPDTGELGNWAAPSAVGWVLPAAGGQLLAGLRDGLHLFDPAGGAFTPYRRLDGEPAGNRLNDAAVDARGRLWFGTMDFDCVAPTGRLYRHDGGAVADTGLAPVPITNGPALSPDGAILYAVDTIGGAITAHEVAEDGSLGRPRPFVRIDPADGVPDGAVVDTEGCLWVGLFGGWGVRRYDPAGALMASVRFPCANVTKIAFGGDGLRTAYATTARAGLSAGQLADQPDAGDLFAFDPGVAGLPCPSIALENEDA